VKHEPNPEEPDRCRVTDLLVTDCAGCRHSDTRFVDALLATEREPAADYEEAQPNDRGRPDLNPLDNLNRGLHRRKWWLDTGPTTELVADSHQFEASWGGRCVARCGEPIKSGQQIVHVNIGGYVHVKCLGEK
jgi:hypothetical protein